MRLRSTATLLAVLLLPVSALAIPAGRESRLDPARLPAFPSYISRVHDAIVGLRVRAAGDAPSSSRLGAQRAGTALVFDARGYAVTVSYLLLDAVSVEARTRDGRTLPGRVVALDLDTGLGVVQLEGGAPWPAVTLGDSRDVRPGMLTGTVGADDDNELVWVTGALQAVRPFTANWEYMLDRALILAPASPSWSGSAVVDDRGRVIGIASLQLGEPPHVNLAIPIEKFVTVKEELIASGRVLSRRPRPWLGLYTANVNGGVVVDGFSATGPAERAGFRKGDRIIQVDGVGVRSREEFYDRLWRRQAGDVVELKIVRDHVVHVIGVRSVDRHHLFTAPAR